MVPGSSSVAVTSPSDFAPASSKKFFAISLAEMLNEATTHFCSFDESYFSNMSTLLICDNRMSRN